MSTAHLPDVGEDVDLTLRHISRQFPEDFARAILPAGTRVTAATWLDTQITSRQRRLDRALDVMADGERRLEHAEWQLRWVPDVPFRMHEYHNLMVTALVHELAAKAPAKKPRPPAAAGPSAEEAAADPDLERTATALHVPVRSTLVLLTGREKPWPEEGSYRTSPPGAPFSGVSFRIDAVYQRTVAELTARGSPLWLIFAPLAVDADEEAMKRVVVLLRERAAGRVFEELAAALLVMADLDRRRRGLREAILRLLDEETVMQSWIYKQGEEKGFEKATARNLHALFVRLVSRQPTPEEERALVRRAPDVSPERLFELAEMPADAFLGWLAAG